MGPLVERHYAVEGDRTTLNLSSVLGHVPPENYERMESLVGSVGRAYERALGTVCDATTFYTFTGDNVLLENGLVQVGKAVTADNPDGFRMTRMFANSIPQMHALERECMLHIPLS